MSTSSKLLKLNGQDPKKDLETKKANDPNSNQSPDSTLKRPPQQKKPFYKKPSFWIWFIVFVFLFLFLTGILFSTNVIQLGFFDGLSTLNSSAVTKIYIYDYHSYYYVIFYTANGDVYSFYANGVIEMTLFDQWLQTYSGPAAIIFPSTTPNFFWVLFWSLLPWVIIIGITFYVMKLIINKQTQVGGINKKSLTPQISNIKFSNLAGYEEVKQELVEIVDFLKNPLKYSQAGARTPKGVMLSGPPGTGKTFFAKAVAGEAGVPFYSISGSDFVEMFVGVGASRVRSLFTQAKSTAPSLIFIDELDAVGRQRGAGVGGGNDEREQTLNQLLVELDGFQANTGIIVIAATNRPDVLDPALKRPGRFDRSIEVRLPDFKERQAILEIYAKQGTKTFAKEINWLNISLRTPGFSPAQLENVINEAAILSVRENKKEITLEIIDESIDRVIAGPSKVNRVISEEERRMIAYHESGHALLGLILPKAEKVQKITIIPRGDAGGYVLMTPKKEKFVQTKSELEAKIISYLGGRVSEEIFFGKEEITTGAYSDIESATSIARKMVTEFGMSNLGPIQYEKNTGSVFLGRDMNKEKSFSDNVAMEIDKEVRIIIDKAYKKAYEIIAKNKPLIDLFAKALLIKETLNAEESEYIFKNRVLPTEILELEAKEIEAKRVDKIKLDNDKKTQKAKSQINKAESETELSDIKDTDSKK